jgi:hypothetical protein
MSVSFFSKISFETFLVPVNVLLAHGRDECINA